MTLLLIILGVAAYAAIGHLAYHWSDSQWRTFNDYLNWKYPTVAKPYDAMKYMDFNILSAVLWPIGLIVLLISEPQRRAQINLVKGTTK